MKLNKIIITALSVLFAGYANAAVNSAFSISLGVNEDFLWAPISARYSTNAPSTDYLWTAVYADAVKFSARAGGGGSVSFECYVYSTDALYAEARAIALSLKETSVLEVFKGKNSTSCSRVILSQRADYLLKTGGNIASGAMAYVTGTGFLTGMNVDMNHDGSNVLAKTDWSGTVTFSSYSGSNISGSGIRNFSCNVSKTNSLYNHAVSVKNGLGNGYILSASAPTSGAECTSITAFFSLGGML